jgi:branched-subunit amino acid ABC-type transport system permease component
MFQVLLNMRDTWKVIYGLLVVWMITTLVLRPGLFIDQLVSGLVFGMILVMIALGLSLILGLMGIVNFAHGAFFMIGGYVAFAMVMQFDIPFLVVLVAVPLIVGIIGALTEVVTIRPLYDKDPGIGLLLTFGLATIIEVVVRIFYTSQTRTITTPTLLDSPVSLGVTTIPAIRLFTVLVGVLSVVGLYTLIHRTNIGLIIRAGVQDAEMAEMTGIDLPRYLTLVFGLGVGLAGLAGLLRGTEVGIFPGMGSTFIIIVFVIVAVGGMGSLFGSVVGGLLIGVATFIGPTMLSIIFDLSQYGLGSIDNIIPFLIMIVVLLDRPQGLFGEEGFIE